MKKEFYISAIFSLIVIFFMKNKKKSDINFSYNYIRKHYGKEAAEYVLAIYKLETANFKSNIFKKTNGAGMIATISTPPYGFSINTMKNVCTNGLYRSINGFNYIKFCSLLDGFKAVANYLTKGNSTQDIAYIRARVARYGSQQPNYRELIESIIT